MQYIPVMLVDDEVLALEYLRNMIHWEDHGFRVVAEATNGRKALELLNKHHPQVAFVDIRMPVMDGLEFCRAASQIHPGMKIILLTAYKDFDYARQAIEMGVGNYILKHDINPDAIIKELIKAKNAIAQQEKNWRYTRQRALRDLILNVKSADAAGEALFDAGNVILLLAQVDQPYPAAYAASLPAQYYPVSSLDIGGDNLPPFVDDVQTVETGDIRYVTALFVKKTCGKLEINGGVYNLARRMQRNFREKENATVTIVASDPISNRERLNAAYLRQTNIAEFSIFFGREQVFLPDSYPAAREPDSEQIGRRLKKLGQAFMEMESQELKQELDGIFELVRLSVHEFRRVCAALGKMVEDSRNARYADESGGQPELYDAAAVRDWYASELAKAAHAAGSPLREGLSKKMQLVLEFIHGNYASDISVSQAAEAAGISSVYLMKLFNTEMGQTFLDYLTNVRIEAAVRLLKDGRLKVYEVADKVGYRSSQYFSQVFKKVTGRNPADIISGEGLDETKH